MAHDTPEGQQQQHGMPPELTPPPRAEYSSNRNTRKARQRKLALTGAAKVEEAARNSDYKAMIYVRKKVAAKDEYKNASDLVKDQMLQQAMAETMEARSKKGQDTTSKMEKYYRGEYDYRHEKAGPDSRVSVTGFMTANRVAPPPLKSGPARTIGARSRPATALVVAESDERDNDDLAQDGEDDSKALSLSREAAAEPLAPVARAIKLSQPPEDRLLMRPPPARSVYSTPPLATHASSTAPVTTLAQSSQVSRLQTEVEALRSIVQNLVSGLGNARHDVTNLNSTLTTVRTDASLLRAEMSVNKAQTDQVVSQMPQMLHALATNRMPGVEERLARVEGVVDELRRRMDEVLMGYDASASADVRRARARTRAENQRREAEELERGEEVAGLREKLRSVGAVLKGPW
ncbi:uncharacterized protein E0L32_001204 [Thyridium curvatum]|uniref:Uncharacterized protein n=1 Tax=Thyridium curvatum TaxID=1093900 RepID=A0A507AXB2_9PEZI|nr:uncharacterized protein E0L32_001204 [Thyridium curvatum]TPX11386.1 hypothetical protein E0L32_001204 [Thyridium curvatum]